MENFGVEAKDQAPYLVAIGIFIGFTLSLLDDPIYQLLEGRIGWPKWLATMRNRRWQCLVDAKYKFQNELLEKDPDAPGNNPDYDECWYLLRQFPVDPRTMTPMATRPSRIGNVIASYEQYASLRYHMDDVFYWPRLWLLVDKEARDAIDNQWAAVDAILYTGFGLALLGAVYSLLAVLSFAATIVGQTGPISGVGLRFWAILGGLLLFLLFYVCIRIAVPGLLSSGENYKSVFDLYRSKLEFKAPTQAEQDEWERKADLLQYGIEGEESKPRLRARKRRSHPG